MSAAKDPRAGWVDAWMDRLWPGWQAMVAPAPELPAPELPAPELPAPELPAPAVSTGSLPGPVVPARRWSIWQCRDFCCSHRHPADRWWNVGRTPGDYDSVPSWADACAQVRSGRLRWDA